MQSEAHDCAVIGCGAVGLATARLLQDAGRDVTIYARDLPPNTTSNIAGAQWAPYTVVDNDARTPTFDRQHERAARFSFRYFQDFVGGEYGVSWRPNYVVGDGPVGFPWEIDVIKDVFPEFRMLDPAEHPFPGANVLQFVTLQIEPAIYLRAVMRDFLLRGGRIRVRTLGDRNDIALLPEAVICNCTGLGARELVGDSEMIPIKGQLTVLLPQPEVSYNTIGGGGYMFPRSDGIMLGGTHERGVETLDVNREAYGRIMEEHRTFFDGMRRRLAEGG
jgi:glycine/D-amino acid oxidase-like deaminating enzyme